MSFEELPITWFDIFCCVEIIGRCSCVHYVNISTLKNVMNTIQHTFLKKLSLWYSRDSRIFKLFFVYSTCSKDGLVAKG